jgi:hypothetical protein
VGKRKPYAERDDLEKIQSQWTKLTGLHTREEWSAAIVRAATAAEIAANIAVRKEFAARSQFSESFINSQLKWANGLAGKLDRLLLPMEENPTRRKVLKQLKSTGDRLNALRNGIVHQGEFANPEDAVAFIAEAKAFIEELVKPYVPGFQLSARSQTSPTE